MVNSDTARLETRKTKLSDANERQLDGVVGNVEVEGGGKRSLSPEQVEVSVNYKDVWQRLVRA